MVLSPDDIHNKEFSTKLRGYNIDEVNDFLEQIIKDYQITLKQNKDLQERLDASEGKLKYFNELKDSLNQSILVAQEAAEKVKNESEQEAQIIVEESQKKARDLLNQSTEKSNQILQDASERARQVTIETDNLKRSVNTFRQGLQGMLKQQLDMVDNPEWSKLNDSTSTDKLKQEVGDQQRPDSSQNYQTDQVNNQQNYENDQNSVFNSEQMNYNDNIQENQPDESYTISHQQNEPTFNFKDDDADDSKK